MKKNYNFNNEGYNHAYHRLSHGIHDVPIFQIHAPMPPHGPYHPSRRPPFGIHLPFGPPPPHEPPLPISRDDFKEIRLLLILSILLDESDGISGYQLQERYNLLRGSMLRDLNELSDKNLVKVQDSSIKGREQKIFSITEKGKHFLEKLKAKWTNRFLMMSEMAPPEEYAHPFHNGPHQIQMIEILEKSQSKEDALDYFRGLRSRLKIFLERLAERENELSMIKTELDDLIDKIEEMKEYNLHAIKEMINEIQKKIT
jgi:DNA-binding PadR family transcriptional regulator